MPLDRASTCSCASARWIAAAINPRPLVTSFNAAGPLRAPSSSASRSNASPRGRDSSAKHRHHCELRAPCPYTYVPHSTQTVCASTLQSCSSQRIASSARRSPACSSSTQSTRPSTGSRLDDPSVSVARPRIAGSQRRTACNSAGIDREGAVSSPWQSTQQTDCVGRSWVASSAQDAQPVGDGC